MSASNQSSTTIWKPSSLEETIVAAIDNGVNLLDLGAVVNPDKEDHADLELRGYDGLSTESWE